LALLSTISAQYANTRRNQHHIVVPNNEAQLEGQDNGERELSLNQRQQRQGQRQAFVVAAQQHFSNLSLSLYIGGVDKPKKGGSSNDIQHQTGPMRA